MTPLARKLRAALLESAAGWAYVAGLRFREMFE